MNCPDQKTLRNRLEGLLSHDQEATIDKHIDSCSKCQLTLESLTTLDHMLIDESSHDDAHDDLLDGLKRSDTGHLRSSLGLANFSKGLQHELDHLVVGDLVGDYLIEKEIQSKQILTLNSSGNLL